MNTELVPEKTYFIMADKSVKTYYRTKLDDGIINVYVFNRDIPTGEEVLNLENVKEVFTAGTKKFDMAIYNLVSFISEDLINDVELRKFFIEVWNEFSDKIFEMQFEKPELPLKLKNYLDDLENRYENPYIVAFFREKYYYQKFKFVPYSEEWFKHHLANKLG